MEITLSLPLIITASVLFVLVAAWVVFRTFLRKKRSMHEPVIDTASLLGVKLQQQYSAEPSLGFTENETTRPDENSLQKKAQPKKLPVMGEIIVLNVMTQDGEEFSGYELLQSLLSSGLRYGDMNIFHRYENLVEQDEVLFSLASVLKPGTFDLENIGAFSTTGLSLFLDTTKVENPISAFELMLETAHLLAEDLEGEACDVRRQPLTKEAIDCYRQQLTASKAEMV